MENLRLEKTVDKIHFVNVDTFKSRSWNYPRHIFAFVLTSSNDSITSVEQLYSLQMYVIQFICQNRKEKKKKKKDLIRTTNISNSFIVTLLFLSH